MRAYAAGTRAAQARRAERESSRNNNSNNNNSNSEPKAKPQDREKPYCWRASSERASEPFWDRPEGPIGEQGGKCQHDGGQAAAQQAHQQQPEAPQSTCMRHPSSLLLLPDRGLARRARRILRERQPKLDEQQHAANTKHLLCKLTRHKLPPDHNNNSINNNNNNKYE